MELPTKALPPGLISSLTGTMPWMKSPLAHAETRRKILVVDADASIHDALGTVADDARYDLISTLSADEAISLLQIHPEEIEGISSVFFAFGIPANRGLQLFTRLREIVKDIPIYLMASHEALEAAKAAQSMGAAGLFMKPIAVSELRKVVIRENSGDRDALRVSSGPMRDAYSRLLGKSPAMEKVSGSIRKAATGDISVLITGEGGVGKETVAAMIHQASARAKMPFVTFHCSSTPKDLIESELFGYARGAVPGAVGSRRGLLEEAHEGTIFIDEIGDLSLPLQAKLLRALQTKQIKAVGSNLARDIDVRVTASTHKNLKTLIQKGEFREDLYYRLNVMAIHVPSLRDRREDISSLAEYFVQKHKCSIGKEIGGFTKAALEKLQSMPWKGNLRELENTIERAMMMCEQNAIDANDISLDEIETACALGNQIEDFFERQMSLKDIEREYIKHVLRKTGNRKEAATKILGIDRKTLYRKEKLYGLKLNNN